jgi:hypothetical protein
MGAARLTDPIAAAGAAASPGPTRVLASTADAGQTAEPLQTTTKQFSAQAQVQLPSTTTNITVYIRG